MANMYVQLIVMNMQSISLSEFFCHLIFDILFRARILWTHEWMNDMYFNKFSSLYYASLSGSCPKTWSHKCLRSLIYYQIHTMSTFWWWSKYQRQYSFAYHVPLPAICCFASWDTKRPWPFSRQLLRYLCHQ